MTRVAQEVARLLAEHDYYGILSDLARAAGVTAQSVGKWGESTPGRRHWPAIEEFFHLKRGHLTAVANGDIPVGEAPSFVAAKPGRTSAEQEPAAPDVALAVDVKATTRDVNPLRTTIAALAAQLRELTETVRQLQEQTDQRMSALERRAGGGGRASR